MNPNNDNKWYFYFYDRVADKRYRTVLTDPATGKYPPNQNCLIYCIRV